ncbi:MAG: DUF1674 domain-containing protein [Gammaproteobacteria bacterium]|jgi:hypothetical protein|nr:DUF1674 domain-containing protein [Gammaproteobacteria bacterium]
MATENAQETPVAPPDAVGDGKGEDAQTPRPEPAKEREIGGPSGLEPTRYGDWERKGRCIDF